MRDLGLDSLDQVEIIMAMEDEFGECFLSTTMFVSEFLKSRKNKVDPIGWHFSVTWQSSY